MSTLPPLAALFLTYFDDIKGQSVIYYSSIDADSVPQGDIEHVSLPSGLHLLDTDLVPIVHQDRPGLGLFRSRVSTSGRGKRMGTLGVVLGAASRAAEDLFGLAPTLEAVYDELEDGGRNPFDQAGNAKEVLDRIWTESKMTDVDAVQGRGGAEVQVHRLVEGRVAFPPSHPIAYLPSLLGMLGPLIITVYKAAVSGQRILLYSQPPLLPIGAFAWCIAALSLSPSSNSGLSAWLGNIGLMDLTALRQRRGGWVATTSDAIYRTHAVYDLLIDLSHSPPLLLLPPAPSSPSSAPAPRTANYHLSDLPLYRCLLMLDQSPPAISLLHPPSASARTHSDGTISKRSLYSGQAGWWLLAFDVFNRVWALCVGVCEYAIGRGSVVGEEVVGKGAIRLGDGEEDARLLPRDLDDIEDEGLLARGEEEAEGEGGSAPGGMEDEAVRRGRLILRQLYHNSYHLHARLVEVTGRRTREKLSDVQIRDLCGGRMFKSSDEMQFWQNLAVRWEMALPGDLEE